MPETAAMSSDAAKSKWIWGTGRRKTAVARVRVADGSGVFLVNGKRKAANPIQYILKTVARAANSSYPLIIIIVSTVA